MLINGNRGAIFPKYGVWPSPTIKKRRVPFIGLLNCYSDDITPCVSGSWSLSCVSRLLGWYTCTWWWWLILLYTEDKFEIITLFFVFGIHGAFGFVTRYIVAFMERQRQDKFKVIIFFLCLWFTEPFRFVFPGVRTSCHRSRSLHGLHEGKFKIWNLMSV